MEIREIRGGFTLIEVIAALVVFSMGVLMVMQVSGALGTQMRFAGARSELAAVANERLDSLRQAPFSGLVAGATSDTITVQGIQYEEQVTITSITAVLAQIEVAIAPIDSTGPSHAVTAYASSPW